MFGRKGSAGRSAGENEGSLLHDWSVCLVNDVLLESYDRILDLVGLLVYPSLCVSLEWLCYNIYLGYLLFSLF